MVIKRVIHKAEPEYYKRWLEFFRENIGFRWDYNFRILEKWEAFSMLENERITPDQLERCKVKSKFHIKQN